MEGEKKSEMVSVEESTMEGPGRKCWTSRATWVLVPVVPLSSCLILDKIPMVSAFSVVNQKVVICVDWKKMYVKMLWKSIKHYPDSRLLLIIFLITPGVFWAWENTFHFSCFPSSQTKKATRDTFPSCYVWIPLGKWGRLSGLFLKQQPKVNSKMWTLRSHPAMGRREFSNVPLMFWWLLGFSYQTWPCPTYFPKRILPTLLLES